jgi:hypothetical protein
MQLIPRFVESQEVEAISEYLPALQKPIWADDDTFVRFAMSHGTSADCNFRLALSVFEALSFEIRALLCCYDICPSREIDISRVTE